VLLGTSKKVSCATPVQFHDLPDVLVKEKRAAAAAFAAGGADMMTSFPGCPLAAAVVVAVVV
jgi:uncharacterized protein (DUF2062 family)